MNVPCPFCAALHWMDEKLARTYFGRPQFGLCCYQGKIRLPLLITPHVALNVLYDGNNDLLKSFQQYTREYNAFTIFGTTLDSRLVTGRGPTSFTIHGELRHHTGSLIPQTDREAVYSQLYIFYPEFALDIRSH